METLEIFTILGLTIFLFVIMVILSVLINMAFDNEGVSNENIGFIFVILVLSIILSIFFTKPEKFGYEKVVSNNFVEQEVI